VISGGEDYVVDKKGTRIRGKGCVDVMRSNRDVGLWGG
jgi:hypothetical protein